MVPARFPVAVVIERTTLSDRWGSEQWSVSAVERDNVNEEIRLTTRAYNAALERLVLRHPEQWFWVHRRWKTSRRPKT